MAAIHLILRIVLLEQQLLFLLFSSRTQITFYLSYLFWCRIIFLLQVFHVFGQIIALNFFGLWEFKTNALISWGVLVLEFLKVVLIPKLPIFYSSKKNSIFILTKERLVQKIFKIDHFLFRIMKSIDRILNNESYGNIFSE